MEKTRNRSFTSAAEGGTSLTGVSVYWLMVFAIAIINDGERREMKRTRNVFIPSCGPCRR